YFRLPTKKHALCNDVLSSLEPSQSSRTDHCSSAKSSNSSLTSWPQNHGVHSSTQNSTAKVDTQNVGSQTFESCLVPCDACYQTQSVLRKTGGALIELFQSEGLPSSLQPLSVAVLDTVELGRMTATDVVQWGSEEYRDMRRLTKHLKDVRGTVEPLKYKIVTAEREKDRLKSDVKRLEKELKEKVENYQATNVQLEFLLKKTERSAKETQQSHQEEQQKSQREISSLEGKNTSLMEKICVQQDRIKILETENLLFQEKIRQLQEEKESSSHQLQNEIQKLEVNISELQLCLHKEKAKYNSACRQQQSMQAKQKCLVERVDALDEECQELQRQLAESEEKLIELHGQIRQMSEEKEQLQATLNQLQESHVKLEKDKETLLTEICDLENTVAELKEHIKAGTEREQLLVAFPDLNPQAPPQSTGNVTLDMEQQFKANCVRIQVLEQENRTLHSSLLKLKERAQLNKEEPQKIWNDRPRTEDYLNNEAQGNLLPSTSAERLQRYSNSRKEAGGESSLKSVTSEDQISASSLSSVQIHFQTLQVHSSSVQTRKTSPTALFHSRIFKHRRK
ncbi:coiled-coil domain-containing protein 157-like, partial [Boleophthalmus pectinirostris]|uniref:coiled-coil domain-containing protein 157-like n=1 Tax=Boleophthalmus pectinirostris TaxID=150288 RepID=UPI00242CDCFC